MQRALVALLLLAPAAAALGIHVVSFRMAFFSDAISHSVFVGVALGLLLAVDVRLTMPLLGVLVAVAVMAYIRSTALPSDTVIGVVFSAVVAAGLALLSRDRSMVGELQRYVYGDILTVTEVDLWVMFGLFVLVMAFEAVHFNRGLLTATSPVVAQVNGVPVRQLQYAFAVLVALVVMLSVRTVGVFLVTALLIVPAAAAQNLARSAGSMFWWALLISVSSAVSGLILSALPAVATATGATVVLMAFAWFLVSVVVARRRGLRTG